MTLNSMVIAVLMAVGIVSPAVAAEPAKPSLSVAAKLVTSATDRNKRDRKQDQDPKKKDEGKKEVTTKGLEVRITSYGGDPGPLKVKSTFLARDFETKSNVVHKEVTVDAKLEGREVTVQIPPVEFETVDGGKKKDASGNMVDAGKTGRDFRGYYVVVTNEAGEVLGKAFSSRAIEQEIDREKK